jgi:hypothetical protein
MMNLQENISRIKEVMGINESTFPISIKRRVNRETLKGYINRAELEYPTLCDHFGNEYEYADAVIDHAIDELLDEVWGYNSYPSTRTVDNHIARLRQKIESNSEDPKHILTVHGVGYKFVA